MERYDSYKNSGVEWIGEIPEEWTLQKSKTLFSERRSKGNAVGVQLAATQAHGMCPQELLESVVRVKEDTDLQNFKTVHVGDFVISLRSFQGGFEGSDYEGVCTPAYTVFYAKKPKSLDFRFFRYLFKSYSFISKINSLTVGIREGKNIQYRDFSNMVLPVPSVCAQRQISRYLDQKTSQIDSLIEKNKKSIELLEEYRKSVISEAVTKGLDPNAPMKDSGVEWIGKIPEGWSIGHLSYFVKSITDLDHYMPESVDLGIPYLMIGDLEDRASKIKFDKCKQISKEDFQRLAKKSRPSVGDLIVARYATIGTSCIVDIDREFLVTYGCLTVTPDLSNLTSEYLFYYMKSDVFLTDLSLQSNSNTQANVGKESLKYSTIIVPSTDEQQRVVLYLDEKTSQIDSLIDKKKQLIEKLQEYRKSLISECVIGKIKVSEVE